MTNHELTQLVCRVLTTAIHRVEQGGTLRDTYKIFMPQQLTHLRNLQGATQAPIVDVLEAAITSRKFTKAKALAHWGELLEGAITTCDLVTVTTQATPKAPKATPKATPKPTLAKRLLCSLMAFCVYGGAVSAEVPKAPKVSSEIAEHLTHYDEKAYDYYLNNAVGVYKCHPLGSAKSLHILNVEKGIITLYSNNKVRSITWGVPNSPAEVNQGRLRTLSDAWLASDESLYAITFSYKTHILTVDDAPFDNGVNRFYCE